MPPSRHRRRIARAWRSRRLQGSHQAAPAASVAPRRAPGLRSRRAERRRAARRATLVAFLGVLRPGTVLLAATVAVVFMASFQLLASPRFRISGARVTGNVRVPDAVIFQASGLEGRPIVRARAAAAAEAIARLPDVATASVKVRFPRRVEIEVRETLLVLGWRAGDRSLAVDEFGRVITVEAGAAPQMAGLPLVEDVSPTPPVAGDSLPLEVVRAALSYTEHFRPVLWIGSEGFQTISATGTPVRLGRSSSPASAERQRAVFDQVADKLQARAVRAELIDLRYPNRPYYRPAVAGSGR